MALDQGNCVLFFDDKFSSEDYGVVEGKMVQSQEERARINAIDTIYGEDEIADEKIVKKCRELASIGFKKEVVLVSSDR